MKHLKTLYVVRHAKSSWDFENTADIDRTLRPKGIKNAYEISRKLKLGNLIPEKIISSPANRALHSATIFARVFGLALKQVEIRSELYESTVARIVDIIHHVDDQCNAVMIFGHNPDFTDVVNHFIKAPIDSIPTSGVVTLKFNATEWKKIDRSNLAEQLCIFPDKEE
jgi:phosphohistidine phosphatase